MSTAGEFRDADGPPQTAAESVGCCLAPSKDECKRPPCPCNLDAYTREELESAHRTPRREDGPL